MNKCIWYYIGGCECNGQECRCNDHLSIYTEQGQELLDRFGKGKDRLSSKYNGSGCRDLTAHEAVEHVSKEEAVTDDKVHLTISIIKAVLKLAGLKQINRLIVQDKRSGRIYK